MLPLDLTAAVLTWLRAHEAGRLLRVQKLPASEFDALTATVRQVGERDERARFGGIGLSITDAKALLRRRFAYKEELLGSIDRLNNSGWTMLMVKVARKSPPNLVADHEDEVRALIAAGADVNFAPAQSRCERDPASARFHDSDRAARPLQGDGAASRRAARTSRVHAASARGRGQRGHARLRPDAPRPHATLVGGVVGSSEYRGDASRSGRGSEHGLEPRGIAAAPRSRQVRRGGFHRGSSQSVRRRKSGAGFRTTRCSPRRGARWLLGRDAQRVAKAVRCRFLSPARLSHVKPPGHKH